MERFENVREPVERGEGDCRVVVDRRNAMQVQSQNMRKGLNPPTLFRVCHRDSPRAADKKGEGMTCGGVGRIRERLLPRFDVFGRRELDRGEEVLSGARNP